jgi:hypothetical protein
MPIKKQNQGALLAKLTGDTGPAEVLTVDRYGLAEISNPAAGVTPVYGPGDYGQPVLLTTNDDAPGALPATSVTVFDEGALDYFLQQKELGALFPLVRAWMPQGTARTNVTSFEALDLLVRCRVTDAPLGGGPTVPYDGSAVQTTRAATAEAVMRIDWGALSAISTVDAENITHLAVLTESSTVPGYPGPNKIMLAMAAAGSSATPNLYVSSNGGSSWSLLGTDPLGTDESAAGLSVRMINNTQYRVTVLRATADGSNPPESVYCDFTLGAYTTVSGWTSAELGATNNQAGEALGDLFPNRSYGAAAGDIYISTDFNANWGSIYYTGSTVINGFCAAPDRSVYAFGASNLLLREGSDRSGFSAVTGPTGSNASTAMAVTGIEGQQTLLLGNGTSIFMSRVSVPSAVGQWTSLKDFGTNKSVKAILPCRNLQLKYGDENFFFVVVDDTAGGVGALWFTWDLGQSWRQVTALSNTGYNGGVISEFSPNLIFIPADDGAIHKYAAA